MGNAALRSLAALQSAKPEDFMGRTVAIDAHNWLYKYLTTTVRFTEKGAYTTEDGVEVANLIGIVRGISKLLQSKVQPVMVFDGIPTELKNEVIEERRRGREMREIRLEEAIKSEDKAEISRLESQTQRLTSTIHKTTRELFELLDVSYVEAPAEGEGQCSYMARHDERVDCAGSDDYDTLLFGSPITLNPSSCMPLIKLGPFISNLGIKRIFFKICFQKLFSLKTIYHFHSAKCEVI